MKKLICCILLASVIVVVATIPAQAVTPALPVPDMPEIPDIGDDIHITIPGEVFDGWFAEHPMPPLVPTEPTLSVYSRFDWLREWFWWMPDSNG